MYDVDDLGIGAVMNEAMGYLQKGGEGDNAHPNPPIHLSYDIDAVDPSSAPATGTRVRGGLTFREAHFVAERAAMSGCLCSADMVELNPNLSEEGSQEGDDTVELGLGITASLMGKAII